MINATQTAEQIRRDEFVKSVLSSFNFSPCLKLTSQDKLNIIDTAISIADGTIAKLDIKSGE